MSKQIVRGEQEVLIFRRRTNPKLVAVVSEKVYSLSETFNTGLRVTITLVSTDVFNAILSKIKRFILRLFRFTAKLRGTKRTLCEFGLKR